MTVDAAAIYERIDAACCTYHGFKSEAEREDYVRNLAERIIELLLIRGPRAQRTA